MGATSTVLNPLSFAGDLASGVLGYLGQKSANKMNYKIAQETNATNMTMAREANAQNYKIFQEQLKYNSPEEQRRMLEEAGYNPASLVENGAHTPVVSSPQMQAGNPAVSAHMGNELAYFNQLGDMAQNMASLASAKKSNEEAKGQQIENEYKREQLDALLTGMGLENKMKDLDYKFANDSFEQRLQRLYHDTDIALEQKNELHMRNALLEVYGEKDIKSKIDLAVATAEKARSEGKQALSQVDLNNILGETSKAQARYYDVQSWYQSNILKSEVHKNEAIAEEANTQGRINRYEAVRKRVDAIVAEATRKTQIKNVMFDYFRSGRDAKSAEMLKRKMFNEIQKINADIDYLDFTQWLEGIEEARKVFHEYIKMP